MALRLKTPATSTPISVDEAKEQCRVDHADEDVFITGLVAAATSYIDGTSGILGRAMVSQVWELYCDSFDGDVIEIPLGPVITIDSVEYLDPVSGNYTLWTKAGNWDSNVISDPASVIPLASWPTAKAAANAVRVTFTAGFGDAKAVPAAIKAAMKLLVADWYENREATIDKPFDQQSAAFKALLAPFRRYII